MNPGTSGPLAVLEFRISLVVVCRQPEIAESFWLIFLPRKSKVVSMSDTRIPPSFMTVVEFPTIMLSDLLALLPEEDEEKIRSAVVENIRRDNASVVLVTFTLFLGCLNHRMEEFSVETQNLFEKLAEMYGRWFYVRIDIS
jgi:hypothetical protein